MAERGDWRLLFAAALASSHFKRMAASDDPLLEDDVLSAAIEVERAAVDRIAGDRGDVDLDRIKRAALEVFEERLKMQPPPRQPWRSRYEAHVQNLRLDLCEPAAPPRRETREGD